MNRQKLSINQITPGMKLAEAVTNAAGVTLMPAGIRLTPMFINRLKKWNVETLEVLVEKTPAERESAESSRKTGVSGINLSAEQEEFARGIAVEVATRFTNVKDNPLMLQLRNAAIKRLIGHGSDGIINVMRRIAAEKMSGGN